MNGVTFIKENGGLGRTLAGESHISALIVYGEKAVAKQVITSMEQLTPLNITIFTNPVLYYHVSEFFRINEGAKLYFESVAVSDGKYTEVKVMQTFAQGDIRQFAICDFKNSIANINYSVGKLDAIAKEFWELNIPASFLISFLVVPSDIAMLPVLRSFEAENVSVVLGQDANGLGGFLAKNGNVSISNIGAVLGAVSKAKVHESIAWVERQNLVTKYTYDIMRVDAPRSRELDVPAFCDGSKLEDYTPFQIRLLNSLGYLFGVKHTGITGTYLNDSFTATSFESDYSYIENNRTISKALRDINKVLVPKISSPMYIDPDTGLLDVASVSALEALCDEVLDQMKRNGNISGFKVSINPNQQVLSTSKLEVVLKIVPVGTLREIEVKIGLTLKKD
ncbi:DUF2586 family protein [Tenacibaculum piscium]|uniref:DUF2586 family protein n=1 Tax=Tenacibaculum piscium TaxID=1458515 RepID=UPI001F245584|nr:DUF2586 family protein [Tenacibaculum piscium]